MNLLVKHPPRDHEEVEYFLGFLIKRINMKIAKADTLPKNPMAFYCNTLGNQGATGTGILETSHTAIHSWDEQNPAKFDFDLYSCSDYDVQQIATMCDSFDIIEGTYVLINRDTDLKVIESGTILEGGVVHPKTIGGVAYKAGDRVKIYIGGELREVTIGEDVGEVSTDTVAKIIKSGEHIEFL